LGDFERIATNDPKQIEEYVTETGVYWRPRLGIWQIWEVEKEKKTLLGECSKRLGGEYAEMLWSDYVYIRQQDIKSVYDFLDKSEIQ